MIKKTRLFSFLSAILLCAVLIRVNSSTTSLAETSAEAGKESAGDPSYPAVGVRTGVYNDGQAALWDLNLLDYLRIFGHKERVRGYQPEQPIAFSHITHVQKNKMECQFCHWTVAKSPYAAIPEVETCNGCHKIIKGKTEFQKEQIKKLDGYVASGLSIPWQKVHVIPDHVKFNHKRHIKAGVSCQSCHGQIPEMPVVQRVSSMKMGWCISCHREKGSSIDCSTCHH